MIWSGAFEDSQWCKQESAKLETMQNDGGGFHYVVARVDESTITGLAATKLWIDFSQQPEGPGGSGLLSLLWGLEDKPLPAAAVTMAAQVDAEMKDGLVTIKACREAGDAEMIVKATATNDMAWTGSPMLLCQAAEALIAMKKTTEALSVLERAQQSFPRALRPKQLQGLALARSGQTIPAQIVLGKLYAAGQIDPETLGILGRTWMDRYKQTKEKNLLLKSRDLYRQAFEAYPRDYYTGINAASKSLLAGEKETASQLAARVGQIVGNVAVPGNYWMTATVAEAQLLKGEIDAAIEMYRAAVLIAPLDYGSQESTFEQAKLLLSELGGSTEQQARLAAVFSKT
jgi:tetratricopeptide (TPR) repeat protein